MNQHDADPGDAWRYADRLHTPEAQRALLQAALQTYLSIRYARTKVNPEEVGTHVDWAALEGQLHRALAAAGHPAGE
ncbi:MAG: hypothetical protein KF863_10815 [Rubrivivax sp.]|nr:hypothetical protein [Rubrivivax sp.]